MYICVCVYVCMCVCVYVCVHVRLRCSPSISAREKIVASKSRSSGIMPLTDSRLSSRWPMRSNALSEQLHDRRDMRDENYFLRQRLLKYTDDHKYSMLRYTCTY